MIQKKSIVADITVCPLSMTGLRVGIESKLSDRCITHLCSWWDRDPGICAILSLAANYRTLKTRASGSGDPDPESARGSASGSPGV